MAKRPNILFMHVDQMHFQAMSAYNNPYVKTSAMDRMAADGYSFRKAYTPMPQCCPARTSWYTGRMSTESGIAGNGDDIIPDLPDLGQWLRKHGDYETVFGGKWHVMGRNVEESFQQIFGYDKGEYADSAIARASMGFLENYNSKKPFFLNVGFHNPHDCCSNFGGRGKFQFAKEIKDKLPPLPKNFKKSRRGKKTSGWKEIDWQYYIYSYYRWVEMVDAEVGRLYDALMNSRFAGNTVIVFTADHGDGLGFHGRVSKGYMEEEAWHVPLMVVYPGKAKKGVQDNDHLSIGVDITATICDYAQVPMMPKMTIGKSLRPIVEGKKVDQWHKYVVGESFIAAGEVAVRDAKYKTIFYCNDTIKVYNLDADPLEMKDLSESSEGKALVTKHKKYLREYINKLELCKSTEGRSAESVNKYLTFYNKMREEK